MGSTYLKANKEGIPESTAFLHTGSPSWEMTRFSWCDDMAANKAGEHSYSSGAIKWSWNMGFYKFIGDKHQSNQWRIKGGKGERVQGPPIQTQKKQILWKKGDFLQKKWFGLP